MKQGKLESTGEPDLIFEYQIDNKGEYEDGYVTGAEATVKFNGHTYYVTFDASEIQGYVTNVYRVGESWGGFRWYEALSNDDQCIIEGIAEVMAEDVYYVPTTREDYEAWSYDDFADKN